jgi:hypothetical protein
MNNWPLLVRLGTLASNAEEPWLRAYLRGTVEWNEPVAGNGDGCIS